MKTIDKLRAIIERGTVSAEEKQFIADLSIKHKLDFDPKKGCDNCYFDQAVLLASKLKEEEPKTCSVRLRDDIDVVINGYRINNATLTDELVERYRGKGLPEHWFV